MHECSVELEVPFHDVDAMRIVWHGHYFKYLELARTQLFRSRKLDAADVRGLDHALVVIESGCRHTAPLCYADRVRVSAWFQDVVYRIYVGYEVFNLTQNKRSARAFTVLASLDSEGQLLHRTPEGIARRIAGPESRADGA
jgi:acyl-CoA thioester hydrolase